MSARAIDRKIEELIEQLSLLERNIRALKPEDLQPERLDKLKAIRESLVDLHARAGYC